MQTRYPFKKQVRRLNTKAKIDFLLGLNEEQKNKYIGQSVLYKGTLQGTDVQIQLSNSRPTIVLTKTQKDLEKICNYIATAALSDD